MKHTTFDCETTGLPDRNADYKVDFMEYPYLVTLSWKIDDMETRDFIINQEGRLIPEAAIAIHGITNEMASASPYTTLDVLIMFLMDGKGSLFTIGHNINFDTSIVKANILRLVADKKISSWFYNEFVEFLKKEQRIDTMMSTIKFCALPGRYPGQFKWPKLLELHEKLFPGETFDAHKSKDDVNACRRCFLKLRELGIL